MTFDEGFYCMHGPVSISIKRSSFAIEKSSFLTRTILNNKMYLYTLLFGWIAATGMVSAVQIPNFDSPGLFKVQAGTTVDQHSFHTTVNYIDWTTAHTQCESLGKGYHLVSIDTKEKKSALLKYLDKEDEGLNEFWTSGTYDGTTKVLVWSTNGLPLPPWAAWADNLPPPAPNTRVSYAYEHGKGIWKFSANTSRKQAICEYVNVTDPSPCYKDADLLILMDSSGSIGQGNYTVALDFAARLAGAWRTDQGTRLGWTIYSTTVIRIFLLTTQLTKTQTESMIRNSTYLNSRTATHAALGDALIQFTVAPRGVPRNLLTITDGRSDLPNSTITAAAKLKATGLRMFSVGIADAHPPELNILAGGDASRVFTVDRFDELYQLLRPISERICV